MKKLTAVISDIEQGHSRVVLHENDAKELVVEVGERVWVTVGKQRAIAVVNHTRRAVAPGSILFFSEAAEKMGVRKGQSVEVEPAEKPASVDFIRAKIDGRSLTRSQIEAIVADLMAEKLASAELSAFVTAVQAHGLSPHETASLTTAIYKSGRQLTWPGKKYVASMHSIGGVAGDRTTMLVVPIVASLGITIPKTVTRAISSASGTADAMEVLCPVALKTEQIQSVVKRTDGCVAWGGAVDLAVADDKLIRVRHPLRLDPEGLVLSSILAKKKAEGVKHVLIDVPTGRGAKVENFEHARNLAQSFKSIGSHLDMNVSCFVTNGANPILSGVGPALEAKAVLEALSNDRHLPLREKSALFAGKLVSMALHIPEERGISLAWRQLTSGKALRKMREIIDAQGGDGDVKPTDIELGEVTCTLCAEADGQVAHVDNRNCSRVGRALGAPTNKMAGLRLHVRRGDKVRKGEPLMDLITTDAARLKFAQRQLREYPVVYMQGLVIDRV